MRINLLEQQVYPITERFKVAEALETLIIDHCEVQALSVVFCGCNYKVDNDTITVILCERAKNGAKTTA